MYLNKVFIFGNLTRDPELRSLPSGVQVASFSVATNRVWKDKDGNKKESAEFHNTVVFGRQAELVAQYLRKGSSLLVEGRIQTRSWDTPQGEKKYRTEIVADRIQFGPKTGVRGEGQSSKAAKNNSEKEKQETETPPAIEYPTEEINPDDIPF